MMVGFLSHWLFLAIVSCVATALLVFLSAEAFGGFHSSIIMLIRLTGVAVLVTPVVIYVFINGKANVGTIQLDINYIVLVISIGICAGLSWYSFYLALESAKLAKVSTSTVTSINYASVALILLLSWYYEREFPDWRNWLGILLVVVGIFLVGVQREKSTEAINSKQYPGLSPKESIDSDG